MDFIRKAPLPTRRTLSVECGVEHIDLASKPSSSLFGSMKGLTREPPPSYSPGDFLRRFGAVIAICLGLALLAQVVVAVTGAN